MANLGQDRGMPRLIHPALPEDVEMAIAFMGNRAQVEILQKLATHGPCTIGTLTEHLDMSRPSLNKHLVLLEDAGLVIGDPPAGHRHGRSVRYRADLTRVRFLADACVAYISNQG